MCANVLVRLKIVPPKSNEKNWNTKKKCENIRNKTV